MTKSAQETKKPMDTILMAINKAVEEWKKDFTEEKISSEVRSMLNKKKDEIALKLLGFEDSWGKWEINKNTPNAAAMEFITAKTEPVVKEWLNKLKLPNLDTVKASAIHKAAERAYYSTLEEAVRRAAWKKAQEDAEKLIAKIAESDDLEKLLKTRALLVTK